MHLHLTGLIPLCCGIYGQLVLRRVIRVSRDPVAAERWHQQYDGFMRISSALLIAVGLLQLAGLL